ncbi:MAG: RnfABCDGE type electron transport complex subunit D [Planctomycetota bacterium]
MAASNPPLLVAGVAPYVRDAQNLRRIMATVLIALVPVFLMACYNTGYQANLAIGEQGMSPVSGWRETVLGWLGIGFTPGSLLANMVRGAFWVVPPLVIAFGVGGVWEWIFCRTRHKPFNEAFWVTAALYGLSLPPGMPMWKAAMGISFGIVFCKHAFGGAGYNVFNTMLVSRGFLFFSFPNHFSGAAPYAAVDAYSTATPLTALNADGMSAVSEAYTWLDAFLGLVPGSLGETSAAACLLGGLLLVGTGVASWRILAGLLLGVVVMVSGLNALLASGVADNPTFAMPIHWHLVVGSIAFGGVYMATDPVTAPASSYGRWVYGFLIGAMIISIRCLNPAYTEGTLLTILFMNAFASLIDYTVLRWFVRRRRRAIDGG